MKFAAISHNTFDSNAVCLLILYLKLTIMEDKKKPLAPEEETLHTTDPQEHMEGPVSSIMQGIKKDAEKPGKEDAEKIRQQEEERRNN